MIRTLLAASLLLLAVPAAAVAAPQRADFKSDRIAVDVSGAGPDVVLIPGLGSSPRIWDPTVRAVAGYRYHVIRVAGFDGSPAAANSSAPLLAPVAGEIARYVREARLNRPFVVGHSLGGAWGMMVAARHPNLISRLMVVDMPPFLAPLIGGEGATVETVRPFAEQARRQIASAVDEKSRRQVAELVVGKARSPRDRTASIDYWLASDPRVTSQGMYELFTSDLRPDLPRITVPITVLWATPEKSPLSEAQAARFYEEAFSGARQAVIRQIRDSHHLIMLDQPAAFHAELRAFLKGD